MTTAVTRTGTVQITPTPDPTTGMIECNWTDPYVLTIPNNVSDPSDWASGIYLAKLTGNNSGKQAYIVFADSNTAYATTNPPPAATPTALSASVASTNQINLTWTDNSTNEDGFTIERSSDGLTFLQIAITPSNVVLYSDGGLTAGTNYYYRVRAYNNNGNSGYSNTVVASTQGATSTYRDNVVADAPVSYWRLGESSGAVAADLMGRNPGSYTGGFTLGQASSLPGDPNTAVLLNGTSGYVQAPNSTSLGLADGPLTLEAWVKRNSVNRNDIIIHKGTGAYQMLFTTGNRLALAKANTATIVQSNRTVTDTAWHHVVATKNGAVSKLYIDGVDVTGTITNQTLVNATSSTLRLGTDSGTWMSGVLDEAAIYNKVLTPQRISAHYAAAPLPAQPSSLAASAISASQINLTWTDNASNETGFNIERSLDNVNFLQIGTAAANTTSYSDTGLTAATAYHYRVRAYNASGESAYSNIANATTPP